MNAKLTLLVALSAVGLGAPACSRPAHAALPETQGVIVRLAPVVPGPLDRPIRAAGVLVAKDERDLSFKVGGVIAQVLVDPGVRIRRGQILATLDATEVEAGVRQAREALAKAQRDATRAQRLAAADSAPIAAAEDSRTALAVAEAALASAEFNLRHTVLTAPDDGWVGYRLAEPGEVAGPGRPVLHVSGTARGMVARVGLSDRDMLAVEPGARVEVRLDVRPDVPLVGRVTEVGRSAARGTGTWQVEVALDPAGAGVPLLSGLTAKVTIPRRIEVAGSVPLEAVVDGDGDSGAVYVIEGGRAHRRPVRIAFLAGDRAALASGVEGVSSVVADGATRVSDGAAVRVSREGE